MAASTAAIDSSQAAGKLYIIEHMEADENSPESLPPWVRLEYAHMLQRTFWSDSPQNKVYFSNLSEKSAKALTSQLGSAGSTSQSPFIATTASVEQLIDNGTLPQKHRICLLDPKAEKVISPEDAQEFDAFLFGGILGDDPPRDRTKELRKLGFPGRHLGPVQMTTDTAVYVTSLVVDQKNKLDELPYVDFPTIQFNKQESVEMPFRYIKDAKTGEPTLPQGMKALLHADTNKSFDDLLATLSVYAKQAHFVTRAKVKGTTTLLSPNSAAAPLPVSAIGKSLRVAKSSKDFVTPGHVRTLLKIPQTPHVS